MTNKDFSNGLAADDCLTKEVSIAISVCANWKLQEKLDVFLYLSGDSDVRGQVKQRLPLLNISPRQRTSPKYVSLSCENEPR
jgi:hypothetical protein